MSVASSILDAIGNTPLVPLRRLPGPSCARVLVKLESANPTGSKKDRAALAMIPRAATAGRLPPAGTVVEYSGGSMGQSLALVATALGFGCLLVSSDAFSPEKRGAMAALGAEVLVVPSDGGRITRELVLKMIETAREISTRPNHYWTDQLNNPDAIFGYHSLGEEIWQQTEGRLDAYVETVGTAHSVHGVTETLWRHNPQIHILAVEPAESAVLSGSPPGAHRIEGIGLGFVAPHWRPELVNEMMTVSTDEAYAMARRLAREEAILAGASTGANVVAALRLAERLGPGCTVVTLAVDTGLKYLSTDVFRPPWQGQDAT